jgi:8-oxo-dGTP pyrophosphatase MutT (NUDIX family)
MKQAVCVLIEHPVTGLVLSVSRGNDLNNWGLPGGKVEEGEQLWMAAVRELEEETGLHVHFSDTRFMEHFHESVSYGDICYNCHTFRIKNGKYIEYLTADGSIRDSSEGKVEWRPWGDLVSNTASFKDYNWELLMKLNKGDDVSDS